MNWLEDLPHIGRLARTPYLEMMNKVYERLHELGFTDMNSYYSVVFQFIGDGARMTDMAKKASMTKQNMKYLLEHLEKMGYVERFEDKTDGRAVLFRLTEKGVSYRDKAYEVIGEVELEWANKIGIENMIQLKKLLAQLNEEILGMNF
ncbi:MAG: winged helix DNA-binding protein [Saprospiraceae bacterium]|nr:winged helix DNA-binding protein [Saprospiraceae bacterium]